MPEQSLICSNCVHAQLLQMCPTLCDSVDCSLPGSSVHGILQERVLECIAIPFSRDLPEPGIEPRSPALQADSLLFEYSFSLLLVDSVFENLSKVYL